MAAGTPPRKVSTLLMPLIHTIASEASDVYYNPRVLGGYLKPGIDIALVDPL